MLFDSKHSIMKSFASILLLNNKHLNFRLLTIQSVRVCFQIMLPMTVYSLDDLIFIEEEMVGFCQYDPKCLCQLMFISQHVQGTNKNLRMICHNFFLSLYIYIFLKARFHVTSF